METVTVIIPCYNERKYIRKCLKSIINNNYNKEYLELLVVDGHSNDGTRNIIKEYVSRYPFIKLLDNPDRIKPRALNKGIYKATGDIIIRMDAHAVYDKEYISKCVKYLEECDADNVGGLRKTLPGKDTELARAIAISISHPFTAGNATYRVGADSKKRVDTVFGGCYRKEVFEEIGLFDERLIRGQDREFNIRLKRAGGKILFSPDIKCYYYARSNLREYIKWIFAGGKTPFYISRIVGYSVLSWRNYIPLLFILGLLFSGIISILHPKLTMLYVSMVSIYLVLNLVFSLSILNEENDFLIFLLMLLIFPLTHITYGIGSLFGLIKSIPNEVSGR